MVIRLLRRLSGGRVDLTAFGVYGAYLAIGGDSWEADMLGESLCKR